jgi:two-component system, chemotaxis family, protein-glutamate methylesterase/glutaminase
MTILRTSFPVKKSIAKNPDAIHYEAVAIGVSSGGMEALSTLLPLLAPSFPMAVMVVQHQHPHADDFLARYLDERCQISVRQADEKDPILPGQIYLAPANYHLLVETDRTFALAVFERVNYARPAIDVLFETAAEVYRQALIGIVLTGANDDGSQGLKTIKDYGGLTIVQDPATAETDAMPRAALEATPVDYVLPLPEIGALLNTLGGTRHGRARTTHNSHRR